MGMDDNSSPQTQPLKDVRRWKFFTAEEEELISSHFEKNISSKVPPKKEEVLRFLALYHKWETVDIKTFTIKCTTCTGICSLVFITMTLKATW